MSAPLSPLYSLTDQEVTRELLALCSEAGPTERRVLLVMIYGDDRGISDKSESLAKLADSIGAAPPEERRVLLYIARRLVATGQRVYGVIDLHADERMWDVEALAEDADATIYRTFAQFKGRPDGLFDRSMETLRMSVTALVKRDVI